MHKNTLTACLLLLLYAPYAQAEIIYLRNDKVVRANIVKITPVFVRMANIDQYGRREYLVDEIQHIEPDATQEKQIPTIAIENIKRRRSNQTNTELRKAALNKATEIVAEAMQEINIQKFEQMPDDVKTIALEVANQLILEAMNNADNMNLIKENVKNQLSFTKDPIHESIDAAATRVKVEPAVSAGSVPKTGGGENDGYIRELIYSDGRQSVYQLIPKDPSKTN